MMKKRLCLVLALCLALGLSVPALGETSFLTITNPGMATAAPEAADPEADPEEADPEAAPEEIPPLEEVPAPAAEPAPVDDGTLLLSFVGDCSLGDAYGSRNTPLSLTKVILEQGTAWPFSTALPFLSADDCSFANLEVVLTTYERGRNKQTAFPLIGRPEFARALTEGSVEVVNTVNNHCMDYGAQGYTESLAALAEQGIQNFGSLFRKEHPEWDVVTTRTVKGCKIGMVGLSYPQNADLQRIRDRITRLRDEGCQLVIVSLHWGREKKYPEPNAGQYTYAQKVIEAGADMIWGHHPHVLQPVCFYQGKPIMFSTGNFIFGTIADMNPYTGIFQLRYRLDGAGNPTLESLHVVPMKTHHKYGEYRPELLQAEEEIRACYGRLVSKKRVNGFDNLPQDFLTTGTVYVLEDGSLSTGRP